MMCTISSGNHAHLYKRIVLDTECYSLTRKLSVLCEGTMDSKTHWRGRSTQITQSSNTRNTLLAGIPQYLRTMLFAKWIIATPPSVYSLKIGIERQIYSNRAVSYSNRTFSDYSIRLQLSLPQTNNVIPSLQLCL